jgi:hypothetical protein
MPQILSPWRIRAQQGKEGIHRQKPGQLRRLLQGMPESLCSRRSEFSRKERNLEADKECPRRKEVNT